MEMNTFYVLFAAAMIAAAKSLEMKAPFKNNLLSQTNGVMLKTGFLLTPYATDGSQNIYYTM